MKNVSLIKVTAVVVFVAFASNFVMANEGTNAVAATVSSITAELKAELTPQNSFAQFIEKFDSDKNGLLSQSEALASESKLLLTEFSKMDADGDLQISEQEFNQYLVIR